MWYNGEPEGDNYTSKSQCLKVDNYRSKYSLQHRALAHTE